MFNSKKIKTRRSLNKNKCTKHNTKSNNNIIFIIIIIIIVIIFICIIFYMFYNSSSSSNISLAKAKLIIDDLRSKSSSESLPNNNYSSLPNNNYTPLTNNNYTTDNNENYTTLYNNNFKDNTENCDIEYEYYDTENNTIVSKNNIDEYEILTNDSK